MLKIDSNIREEMIAHARADFPLECCGILCGDDQAVSYIYRMKNMDKSRTSYFMDPQEQIKVFKEIRKKGMEMKAIYHSHPNHPAFPSMTDVDLAYYPEVVYIIMSIDDKRDIVMRGFTIIDRKISETELVFLPQNG